MTTGFATHHLESLETRRFLAADLLADVSGIYPTDSVQIGGISYFAANDGVHGKELWKSNGTEAGTILVADILPVTGSSNPANLVVLDGVVLFTANKAIYRADGSDVTKLADLGQGFNSAHVAVLNGKAILITNNDGGVVDVWASDGTVAGTQKVKNLYTSSSDEVRLHIADSSLFLNGAMMKVVGDHVLYLDLTGRLFSTDGTEQGTVELATDQTEHQYARSIVMLDGEALFLTSVVDIELVGDHTVQATLSGSLKLWKTDGTAAGTEVIHAIPSGTLGFLQSASGKVYFGSSDSEENLTLWVTDGTSQGTHEVVALPDTVRLAGMQALPDGRVLLTLDGKGSSDESSLWVSDGTAGGTAQVASLGAAGVFVQETLVRDNVSVGGSVYFLRAHNLFQQGTIRPEMGVQLWRSDGTTAGTGAITTYHDGGTFLDYDIELVDGKIAVTTPTNTYVLAPETANVPVGANQGKTTLVDRVLRIFGTRNDDAIRIYRMSNNPDRFVVNLNGVKRTFAFADVRKVIVYGYDGNDNIAFSEINGVVAIRSMIRGGSGDDSIYGGSTRDSIWGEGGDDFIHTSTANDEAYGGTGDDTLLGVAGDDTLNGEEGADSVIGGANRDMVSGGFDESDDSLDGGAGADVIFGSAVFEIFFGGEQAGDPLDDVLLA